MANPRVTGLRGLEVAVYDLNESAEYYRKAWALEEVSRDGNKMQLRATGPEHHVLTLHERPKAGLVCVNFAADDKASVDALHAKALASGATVVSTPHALPAADGGGYGFEVNTPDGHMMRVSSNLDVHAVTSLDISRPWRINHVVLNSEDTQKEMRFYLNTLGFKHSDTTEIMSFIRCSVNHHSIAIAKHGGPSLNHMAYEMHNYEGLMQGTGRVRLAGHEIGWGVGRHAGPGQNIFAYFVDPNGFSTEYTTEVDQVDDTYQEHFADFWSAKPLRPCAWAGNKTVPSAAAVRAMSGKAVAERNAASDTTCDDVISQKLAS
ncbi:VOC family protein [Roseiarcaceae bacterium H3SJ34-1]|uniref:VOC family protein n=1 Tax=Terripilifer ovatus TaxID=3032367 RepID=UPI003AB96DBF|nr:VOC family protein [Roseiarcaceae bacterium H3SJ34-1]